MTRSPYRNALAFTILLAAACGRSAATKSADAAAPDAQDAAIILDAPAYELPASTRIVHSLEGQYCSTSVKDNPFNICRPQDNLVCINTRGQPDGGGTANSTCRVRCTPGGEACPISGDVCCPGDVHNEPSPTGHACTPPGQCATR
jgi:hypothetical protein